MSAHRIRLHLAPLALALLATPAFAQHAHHPPPASAPPAAAAHQHDDAAQSKTAPAAHGHEHDHAAQSTAATDAHDHAAPPTATANADAEAHPGHAHGAKAPSPAPTDPHAQHRHGAGSDVPREPIPPLTDAERAAAFPDVGGHAAHDHATFADLLVDRLETSDDGERPFAWEATGWYGGDLHRAWLRTEGEREHGGTEASIELLYGRAVARWWDTVAGVRHEAGEGPSRTWAAFGVQGLAPYKFEVEATVYVGSGGRTAARLEAEYDTLITNRWIVQWQAEATLYGRDDTARGIGSGLSTLEAGARLRYEASRRIAPYLGVQWERAYGRTADLRRATHEGVDDVRVVAGVRLWF
ncbi:MAG TPA: copper resistance protein B [Lysobacter sp.]|nr:copper resistance protein B [Lysobacter sp.]